MTDTARHRGGECRIASEAFCPLHHAHPPKPVRPVAMNYNVHFNDEDKPRLPTHKTEEAAHDWAAETKPGVDYDILTSGENAVGAAARTHHKAR